MTDAPFTETHRATLQAWLDIPVPTYPTPCGPLDAAIRAALAEIDRLTKEVEAMRSENPPPLPRLRRRPLHWKGTP